MALDHSRLGVEKKILGKHEPNFLRSRSLFKILANKSVCKPTFYTFLYITSEEKEYYEALLLSYRPRTKYSISQFFKTNCIHSIFGTIEAGVDF